MQTPNQIALARFARGDARVVGMAMAADVVDGMAHADRVLTHAGPPIAFERMCAPMQGALAGAAVFEGWAASPDEALGLLAHDEIELRSNHDSGCVAPMAGVISPSMRAVVVENPTFGNRAATILNEGNVRQSLRCGANGPAVIERLRWLNGPVADAIGASVSPGLTLRDLMAEAIVMGDELHQRNVAGSLLLLRALLPRLLGEVCSLDVVEYLSHSPQAFLNFAMVAAKVLLDPLAGIEGCSIVTAMSRNGVEFGIRVSGTGDRWFTAPAPMPAGRYWEGYGPADANPDIGDSAIVETAGVGGFALPGAPALHAAVGCADGTAAEIQSDLWRIVATASPFFGTPFGIDVLAVADNEVTPLITTGIAHRTAGYGQVGVGMVRAPLACFTAAADALARVPAHLGGERHARS